MEKLVYQIVIEAPSKIVWETMLAPETYKQWVAKSWPDSFYEGKWAENERIKFICPDGSGTLAELVEVKPYERILAKHLAILQPGGVEDRTSETARGWSGITEGYQFSETNGVTTLTVEIHTNPQWRKMFDDGWPTALEELKKISERRLAKV